MRTKRDGSSVVPTLIVAGDVVVHTVLALRHAAIVVATHAGGLGWQLALAGPTLILQSLSFSLSLSRSLSSFLSVSG